MDFIFNLDVEQGIKLITKCISEYNKEIAHKEYCAALPIMLFAGKDSFMTFDQWYNQGTSKPTTKEQAEVIKKQAYENVDDILNMVCPC